MGRKVLKRDWMDISGERGERGDWVLSRISRESKAWRKADSVPDIPRV